MPFKSEKVKGIIRAGWEATRHVPNGHEFVLFLNKSLKVLKREIKKFL